RPLRVHRGKHRQVRFLTSVRRWSLPVSLTISNVCFIHLFGTPMKKKPRLLIPLLLVVAAAVYAFTSLRPSTLTLTGIVTTNDVVLSPQVAGQLAELRVSEGDSVKKGQLLAVIAPEELRADTAYYAQNAAGVSSQVKESEAALRFEESATDHQTAQAVSNLAASEAQVQAAAADLEAARATYTRTQDLARQQIA